MIAAISTTVGQTVASVDRLAAVVLFVRFLALLRRRSWFTTALHRPAQTIWLLRPSQPVWASSVVHFSFSQLATWCLVCGPVKYPYWLTYWSVLSIRSMQKSVAMRCANCCCSLYFFISLRTSLILSNCVAGRPCLQALSHRITTNSINSQKTIPWW